MKKSIYLLLLLILSGCAGGGYIQPIDGQPYGTVTNTEKEVESQYNWRFFFIQEIDGVEVSYSEEFWTGSGAIDATRKVSPGKHNFLVRVSFVRSFSSGGPYVSFVPISANIESDVDYQLVGKINNAGVQAWFENVNGEIVSEIGKTDVENMPKQ